MSRVLGSTCAALSPTQEMKVEAPKAHPPHRRGCLLEEEAKARAFLDYREPILVKWNSRYEVCPGVHSPVIAKQLYGMPSEVLTNRAAKSLVWVRVFSCPSSFCDLFSRL
ncbi:hypothetical protein B296_00031187 [Ensete ventricosum]|uniref:Uncharacterized protein n=1 Tax=Ensete ventricosum TaxID=4639 RepID=A0A427A6I0_ENSVE|nr:hypothetical protein B296_00031187 [Ensete ventricosum]